MHIIPHHKLPEKTRGYFLHGTNAHEIEITSIFMTKFTNSNFLHYWVCPEY